LLWRIFVLIIWRSLEAATRRNFYNQLLMATKKQPTAKKSAVANAAPAGKKLIIAEKP